MDAKPIRFITEPVEVLFDKKPTLEKKTGCPDGFTWRGVEYQVTRLLAEWHDYERRGRMSVNMRPEHASTARRRGSWGVGQDYYRVQVDTGQVFDLYYDRAPKGSDERKGTWLLFQELDSTRLTQDQPTQDQE